jgi:hypothetical protein
VLKDVGQRRREAALHREVAAVKQGHFYSSENGQMKTETRTRAAA